MSFVLKIALALAGRNACQIDTVADNKVEYFKWGRGNCKARQTFITRTSTKTGAAIFDHYWLRPEFFRISSDVFSSVNNMKKNH